MTGPRYSIIPADAVADHRLSHVSLRVLAVLGTHTDNNGWCYIRQRSIADRIGVSQRYAAQAVTDLLNKGYIRSRHRFGENGAQVASFYQVVMDREPATLGAPEESERPDGLARTSEVQPAHKAGEGMNYSSGGAGIIVHGGDEQEFMGGMNYGSYLLPSEDNDLFLERPLSCDSRPPSTLSAIRSPKKAPSAKITPFSELVTVLDDERARAVVDHRQKIRKPLTAHAARLLAAKFAEATDPNAAADLMIERGWQGFDPAWVATRGRTEAPRQMSLAEHAVRKLARMRDGEIDGQ